MTQQPYDTSGDKWADLRDKAERAIRGDMTHALSLDPHMLLDLLADLARKDECGATHPTIVGPACALPRNHAEDHLSTTGCAGSEVRWQTAEAALVEAQRQEVALNTEIRGLRDALGEARRRAADAEQAAEQAERQVREIREALDTLVRLKDGPRDDAYRAAKEAAWEAARAALSGVSGPTAEAGDD